MYMVFISHFPHTHVSFSLIHTVLFHVCNSNLCPAIHTVFISHFLHTYVSFSLIHTVFFHACNRTLFPAISTLFISHFPHIYVSFSLIHTYVSFSSMHTGFLHGCNSTLFPAIYMVLVRCVTCLFLLVTLHITTSLFPWYIRFFSLYGIALYSLWYVWVLMRCVLIRCRAWLFLLDVWRDSFY